MSALLLFREILKGRSSMEGGPIVEKHDLTPFEVNRNCTDPFADLVEKVNRRPLGERLGQMPGPPDRLGPEVEHAN